MARPNRGKYPTGAEGHASFRKDLAKWLKDQKEAKAKANKITSTKKNIEKQKNPTIKKTKAKPVKELAKKKTSATKKPSTTKKTTTKTVKPNTVKKTATTTTKKVAKQVVKKKPLLTPKQKLQIKKGVKTTLDTTKKVVGSGVKTSKKIIKDTKAKAKPYQESLKKYKGKKPQTKLQRWAKAGNDQLKKAGKYTKKQVLPKAKKDLLKIGKNLRNSKNFGKNVAGIRGLGLSVAANMATDAVLDRINKPSNMSWDDWEKRKQMRDEDLSVFNSAKRTVKGIRNVATGKNWFENNRSHREKFRYEKNKKRKKEQSKNTNISKNKNLKINKSDDYLGDKKKPNKTNKTTNKSNSSYYPYGGLPSSEKGMYGGISNQTKSKDKSKSPKKRLTAREKMRAKNVERFGQAHVDRLIKKNKEFQEIKRIKDRNERKKRREEYRQKYGR